MTTHMLLRCPNCDHEGFANDRFCESCGADLITLRDAPREHLEVVTPCAAGVSDRGLRHDRNEDAMFLDTSGNQTVAVVCDGVSSSVAPQIAAQVAAGAAGVHLVRLLSADAIRPAASVALAGALAHAAAEVAALPWLTTDADSEAPSCTIVAAVWDGSTVTASWTGDSRAYWIDDAGARQLTADHSWLQLSRDANGSSDADPSNDPRRHSITRWLGADAPDEPPPVVSLEPATDGLLILCSDGLWNYLPSADEMAERCRDLGDRSPLAIARSLVGHALRSGGQDNVTVVVIDATPSPTSSEGGPG